MKTFALIQGDFVPAPGGYLLFQGTQKIHQDLSLALREEYGGDTLHPRWGSILRSMVGGPITPEMKQQILGEINRVISNYIAVQNARIAQDSVTGSVSRLTSDDVVNAVSAVTAQQIYDQIVVRVTLETLSRQSINVNQVIS